ncbi:MAG: inositol monophosphatase family protein [Alphaproteobacteria bacterium]|nr:inositol monophosphatase family protein [Alphaproteobacteria bacterium]
MFKKILIEAVELGGQLLEFYFNKPYKIDYKAEGINNLVTEIDQKIETELKNLILNKFPEHEFLGEEYGEKSEFNAQYKWILDPIDGTINFFHKIPICATSLALEKDGDIIMGAVYNPLMKEFFFAEKGQGAFLNNQKIVVSQNNNIEKSILVTGFPYSLVEPQKTMKIFEKIISKGISIRRLGSAAIDLCWVACGRFDAFYEGHLKPWDSAAGMLIVSEAGGLLTDFDNKPYSIYSPSIVASNSKIHTQLINFIQ